MPSTVHTLNVDKAIALVEQREEAICDANAGFEKDIVYFVDNFVLPRDPAKWAKEYGKQLSTQHVAYLQQVREELQLQSHNLRMFHARPRPDHSPGEDPYELGDMKDLNAMSKLVKLVSAAVRHTKKMTRLYTEFMRTRSRLQNSDALTAPDRVFIEKSLPGIASVMAVMTVRTKTLQEKLKGFKQPFYLLADQNEVSDCMARLLSSEIGADAFADDASEPFSELLCLAQIRQTIVKDAENIAISQALAWLSLLSGRVPINIYNREVEKYKPLLDTVKKQKVVHNRYIKDLLMLHERANGWPQDVVGPDGHPISLSVIRSTMEEYEWITETSYQVMEATQPINKSLETFNGQLLKLL